jgi:hypothetical protein
LKMNPCILSQCLEMPFQSYKKWALRKYFDAYLFHMWLSCWLGILLVALALAKKTRKSSSGNRSSRMSISMMYWTSASLRLTFLLSYVNSSSVFCGFRFWLPIAHH